MVDRGAGPSATDAPPPGTGRFGWTAELGGAFTFEATRLRSAHPPHLHAWYCIYLVTAGFVEVGRRNERRVAEPGESVLLEPFEVHEEYFDPVAGCSFLGIYPCPGGWTPAGADEGHPAITLARRYLEQAHKAPPTMAALTALTGMSRYHLSRLFSRAVGLSPYAYYEQVRLARARLAIHRGAPLSQAAFESGYSDQSHFTRQFRSRTGTTPGRYARSLLDALRQSGLTNSSAQSSSPRH